MPGEEIPITFVGSRPGEKLYEVRQTGHSLNNGRIPCASRRVRAELVMIDEHPGITGGFMSNHSGSYMLNEVIKLLEKNEIFEFLGRDKTQQLILDIVKISYNYDCNPGEILHGIGERLGICYYCRKPGNDFEDGICINCRKDW